MLVYQEPPDDNCPPGTRSLRADVTGLEESLARMEPTFAEGPPTEGPVDTEGSFRLMSDRTALQIPIVVAGEVGRMLRVIWRRALATDRPETLVLARRLADHAGLALEHAERRRAPGAADAQRRRERRVPRRRRRGAGGQRRPRSSSAPQPSRRRRRRWARRQDRSCG